MEPSPASQSATESQQTLDNEHLVQLGLVDAVIESVSNGESQKNVAQLLGQFVDYTELHFMSEQVLMRHHAYPGYDEHVRDHDVIIERLHQLRDEFDADTATLTTERASRLKGELMGHIRNRDAALHAYITKDGDRHP
jgi:hemerythrin-like metal-binding protein